jgi:hypothetical protein
MAGRENADAPFSLVCVKIRESLPGRVKITWFQAMCKWVDPPAMFLVFNALHGYSRLDGGVQLESRKQNPFQAEERVTRRQGMER